MTMSIEELIDKFSTGDGLALGANTVMQSLRPGSLYSMSLRGGEFIIEYWDPANKSNPPTQREITDEYARQMAIADCVQYFNRLIRFKPNQGAWVIKKD